MLLHQSYTINWRNATTARSSATPASTAEIDINSAPEALATRLAIVVLTLTQPGEPHKTIEYGRLAANERISALDSAIKCACPTV